MNKTLKVEWYVKDKTTSLSEIYQKTGMVFSFVSSAAEGLKQCHTWVKCRDFLHDAVRVQITDKQCSIYGFRFSKGVNPPIDLAKMRMLVSKNALKDSKEDLITFNLQIKSGLKIIRCFEKVAGVKPSVLKTINTDGSSYKAIYMFIGDGMWMKSPFMVSLYTFLIRLGDKMLIFETEEELFESLKALAKTSVPGGNGTDNDLTYLPDCYKHLFTIARKHKELFPVDKNGMHDIYTKDIEIGSFHNNSGILSLSRKQTCDKVFNQTLQEAL
jgi:hypothetical protein